MVRPARPTAETSSSYLSTVAEELGASLLPALLVGTLAASPGALGVIEGLALGFGSALRLSGGALARSPARRERAQVTGSAGVAVFTAATAAAVAVWQVGIARIGVLMARGLELPIGHVGIAERTPVPRLGRAYGTERAAVNLGGATGAAIAALLFVLFGLRTAIALAVIPGAIAVVVALRARPEDERGKIGAGAGADDPDPDRRGPATASAEPGPSAHEPAAPVSPPAASSATRPDPPPPAPPVPTAPGPGAPSPLPPLRHAVRQVARGRLGWTLGGITLLEFANIAFTLLILRAVTLLREEHGFHDAVLLAVLLFVGYRLAAAASSVIGGATVDRVGPLRVTGLGAVFLLAGYGIFALSSGGSIALVGAAMVLAGIGEGLLETSEHSAVARSAPAVAVGPAFGLLTAIQSSGRVVASVVAGLLWTLVSPEAGLLYTAPLLVLCPVLLWRAGRRRGPAAPVAMSSASPTGL